MVYFLMFHCQPEPDAEDIDGIQGGYINCYIEADTVDKADKIARKGIRKMKWRILDREEAYEVNAYSIRDEGREYYEQALIDKEVYALHTYQYDEEEN